MPLSPPRLRCCCSIITSVTSAECFGTYLLPANWVMDGFFPFLGSSLTGIYFSCKTQIKSTLHNTGPLCIMRRGTVTATFLNHWSHLTQIWLRITISMYFTHNANTVSRFSKTLFWCVSLSQGRRVTSVLPLKHCCSFSPVPSHSVRLQRALCSSAPGTNGGKSLKIKYIHLLATLFSSGRLANDLDKALRSGMRHFHGQLSVTLLPPPLLSQSLTGELSRTMRRRPTMVFLKTPVCVVKQAEEQLQRGFPRPLCKCNYLVSSYISNPGRCTFFIKKK